MLEINSDAERSDSKYAIAQETMDVLQTCEQKRTVDLINSSDHSLNVLGLDQGDYILA